MKPLVAQTLRSRWLAGVVHAALWVLLYLAAFSVGGLTPVYREADGTTLVARTPAPLAKLERLFSPNQLASIVGTSNAAPINPFFTAHFTPAPAPAPPPPTTRKIELVYQGFYSTTNEVKLTMVKLGEDYLITPVGKKITANLFAANASVMSLLLTNATGQTNLLPLNVKKEVEVPIK